MKEIQIFSHEMFGDIRTMTNEKGETYFVGKDVAEALGYSDPQKALKMHVDNEDKLTRQIVVWTPEGVRYLNSQVRRDGRPEVHVQLDVFVEN